uniref:Uncharacterized protein n=1 Tax=Rhizophora mucronata TaxID=61149 RepID=A0A2P2K8Q8_RHIMU
MLKMIYYKTEQRKEQRSSSTKICRK